MSPSAHNRQPWKVKVVKRDEKDATLSTQW
jgi:nitroreductase